MSNSYVPICGFKKIIPLNQWRDKMQKLTLEQKEQLRKARRETYLKMKEKRDNDPKYIALKEAQKKRRKDAYQKNETPRGKPTRYLRKI